ncbi:Choline dehydrogenase [Pyrenophora teres f. maculata]|nr:Choline dehydrogenase [Pyrenophora teres f. maculata]
MALMYLFAVLSFIAQLGNRGVWAKTSTQLSDLQDSYDFIIVGGGTAGLTIANRLSENFTHSVLVIEAGPIDSNRKEVTVPWFSAVGYMRPLFEWNISTVPQPGLNNQEIMCNQAKVLGGASLKHALVFDRAAPGDFDAFKSLGINGWSWKDIIPYYKKFESFTPPPQAKVENFGAVFEQQCHGFSGPLGVGWNDYIFPKDVAFLQALDSLKIPRSRDPACNKLGTFLMPSSLDQHNQSRTDSKTAYYDTALSRVNLDVLYLNQATKILTENMNGSVKATGVEFAASREASRHTVQAKKEVIITAGALRSPHILLLSGIGQAERITKHNITHVVELPGVGFNVHDQFTVPLSYDVKAGVPTSDDENNAAFMKEQEMLYYHNRTGRWTRGYASIFSFMPISKLAELTGDANSFISESYTAFDDSSISNDTPITVAAGYRRQWKVMRDFLSRDSMAAWEITFVGGSKYTTATHLHPLSRGNVSLASSDPFDNPLVDPRFLDHPADYEALFEGVRILRRIANTDEVTNTLQLTETGPGMRVTSDDELRKWISRGSATGNHYVGSCAMLPKRRVVLWMPLSEFTVYQIYASLMLVF